MDIDEVMSLSDRNARQTSELSMDDIEAAQALEGLRAGMHLAIPGRTFESNRNRRQTSPPCE